MDSRVFCGFLRSCSILHKTLKPSKQRWLFSDLQGKCLYNWPSLSFLLGQQVLRPLWLCMYLLQKYEWHEKVHWWKLGQGLSKVWRILGLLTFNFAPGYEKVLSAQFPLISDTWISLVTQAFALCFFLITSSVCGSYECVGREPVLKHIRRLCLSLQDMLVLYSPCSRYAKVVSVPQKWTLTNRQLFKKNGSNHLLSYPRIQMDLGGGEGRCWKCEK